jgi:hypothetical protein
MSIIGDALKKAQSQRTVGASAPEAAPVKVDRPVSVERAPQPAPRTSQAFWLVLIAAALIAAGGYYAFRTSRFDRLKTAANQPTVNGATPVAAARTEPSPPPAVVPPAAEPVAAAGKADATQTQPNVMSAVPVALPKPIPAAALPALSGIFYSEKNPVAILDGNSVMEGERVGAYQVVKILPEDVVLQSDGGGETKLHLK